MHSGNPRAANDEKQATGCRPRPSPTRGEAILLAFRVRRTRRWTSRRHEARPYYLPRKMQETNREIARTEHSLAMKAPTPCSVNTAIRPKP